MKKIITNEIVFLMFAILTSQDIRGQGTLYLSNVGQTTAGSLVVGSNSWLAADFRTGNNSDGYALDLIALEMSNATDSPSGFTVMLYSSVAGLSVNPGNNLETLNGPTNPVTSGTYTYTDTSNLVLLPSTDYFIVLTAATMTADGAYNWSYVTANSYNPSGGWSFPLNGILGSSNGSSWSTQFVSSFPQFAITATPIPEPGILSLFGLGGLLFIRHCRKAKIVL